MDTLIQATKDGDHSRLQALSDSGTRITEDDNEVAEEIEYKDNEEVNVRVRPVWPLMN